jgi:hypothetical protein
MRVVNPTFGQSAAGGEAIEARPVDWRKDPIVLFSNSKPNARELLEGVRDRLGGLRPAESVGFVYKASASQPAPNALYDEIAEKYRGALLAIAD